MPTAALGLALPDPIGSFSASEGISTVRSDDTTAERHVSLSASDSSATDTRFRSHSRWRPRRPHGELDNTLLPHLASFIVEALRYDSPVQISGRVALDESRIGDYLVRKGEHVYLHVGAANRDDKVFANADVFDESRQPMHLGFGWGPTRCVGSEFAAACATEYLTAFLARFSRVHYHNEQTRFDHGLSARGLKAASFSLGRR
ncbi:cytochrome P450 [Burkholderia anthina]|uniref:cytochrome P450 n=1 Tax=Burkholderia anthina TaxID=179879 RepID=UPI0037C5FE53